MTSRLQKNLSNKKKFTVFLIGLGKAGYGNLKKKPSNKSHFYQLKKSNFFEIKYLFDINKKNLPGLKNSKNQNIIKSFKSFKKVNKTDITVISVPVNSNLNIIKKLKKNKILSEIIILEKPVAYNLVNFKKIQKCQL